MKSISFTQDSTQEHKLTFLNSKSEELKRINSLKLPTKQYISALSKLFNVSLDPIKKNLKIFLAGFIVGEGSLNVNAKKQKDAPFGFYLDMQFSVTQHENNIVYLIYLVSLFNTGTIRFKSGSVATYVYSIEPRTTLSEKIVPFWESYIYSTSSDYYKIRFNLFKKMLQLFEEDKHTSLKSFKEEMVPIWNQMRKQVGQSNQTFKNSQEALNYVDAVVLEKKKSKNLI